MKNFPSWIQIRTLNADPGGKMNAWIHSPALKAVVAKPEPMCYAGNFERGIRIPIIYSTRKNALEKLHARKRSKGERKCFFWQQQVIGHSF